MNFFLFLFLRANHTANISACLNYNFSDIHVPKMNVLGVLVTVFYGGKSIWV